MLIAPAIVALTVREEPMTAVRLAIAGVALLVVVGAVLVSKRRDLAIGGDDATGPPVEVEDEATWSDIAARREA